LDSPVAWANSRGDKSKGGAAAGIGEPSQSAPAGTGTTPAAVGCRPIINPITGTEERPS
jgi:hypothetical protein